MNVFDKYISLSTDEAILMAILLISVFFAMSVCVLITCNYKYYQDEIWKEKLEKAKFLFNEKSQIIIIICFALILVHLMLLWFI